jgi:hypothetical protein
MQCLYDEVVSCSDSEQSLHAKDSEVVLVSLLPLRVESCVLQTMQRYVGLEMTMRTPDSVVQIFSGSIKASLEDLTKTV